MPEWYCARTHFNQEFEARKHLDRRGFLTFLPCYLVKTKSRNIQHRLLFRNYIFFQLDDPALWPLVKHTFGVQQVLLYSPIEDHATPWYQMPSAVATKAIESLRAIALVEDQIRQVHKPREIITPGCHVRILKGPLQKFSIQKPVVEWVDEDRVGIILSIFGRTHEFEFFHKDLALAEPDNAKS